MSRNSSLLPLLAVVGLLSGCADYLNHYDTITLAAGDANAHNRLLHTDKPFNPASEETRIPTDGQRAADAVLVYRTSQQAAPQSQPQAVININNKDD
ncbi:hypothetical protein EET67_18610 [Pseudaminobacter arsenicus]|uniref:Uncharacterized protein n=1 Tax=Borborobacter arsenicus TaxID=1851146 RepID=A0A432V2N2_9HYPH|nr:hypothetical protein [Pseudaminobacter arsenicus]RUM96360.1 hypothetical protein EET67_18610 [Pseudaminobacter arsenicus]